MAPRKHSDSPDPAPMQYAIAASYDSLVDFYDFIAALVVATATYPLWISGSFLGLLIVLPCLTASIQPCGWGFAAVKLSTHEDAKLAECRAQVTMADHIASMPKDKWILDSVSDRHTVGDCDLLTEPFYGVLEKKFDGKSYPRGRGHVALRFISPEDATHKPYLQPIMLSLNNVRWETGSEKSISLSRIALEGVPVSTVTLDEKNPEDLSLFFTLYNATAFRQNEELFYSLEAWTKPSWGSQCKQLPNNLAADHSWLSEYADSEL